MTKRNERIATLVKMKKWGSSMAVLIPRHFARTRRIEVGTLLDIESVAVVKSPRRGRRRRLKLSELMAHFRPSHRQGVWDVGNSVGREVW
jgi:antitoxin component of MazEF toxin-antitoxin module